MEPSLRDLPYIDMTIEIHNIGIKKKEIEGFIANHRTLTHTHTHTMIISDKIPEL